VDRLQNLTVTEPPQPPPQSWGTPPPPQPTWSQQHAAPGYGQPSGQPPGQPSGGAGSKLPWVLGGVAALVLLVVVGLVMLLRGSDADTSDPQAAASSFVAAAKDGDCDAFTAVTSQHFQDAYGRCQGDVNTAGFLGATGVVIDDAIGIRLMGFLTLGYDHRLVDGAVADQFMADVKKGIEHFDPAQV